MEVESVVTDTPSNSTLFCSGCTLVGLAFDAEVHDVVSTNGTIVHYNVPSP